MNTGNKATEVLNSKASDLTIKNTSPIESSEISNANIADSSHLTNQDASVEALTNEAVLNSESALSVFSSAPELQQIVELIEIGGPVVWILIALSVFSLSIILLKLWQFAILRPESFQLTEHALNFWQNRDLLSARKVLNNKRPLNQIVLLAMEGLSQGQEQSHLQEELSRQANRFINQLKSLLRPLEVVASLSPLLGLMGTVLGMIVAFQQMEAAGSQVDPSVLSGGIWQALLTTAAGLAVAIPVAAMHSWLDRKVERVSQKLNDVVTQVFTQHNNAPSMLPLTEVNDRAA